MAPNQNVTIEKLIWKDWRQLLILILLILLILLIRLLWFRWLPLIVARILVFRPLLLGSSRNRNLNASFVRLPLCLPIFFIHVHDYSIHVVFHRFVILFLTLVGHILIFSWVSFFPFYFFMLVLWEHLLLAFFLEQIDFFCLEDSELFVRQGIDNRLFRMLAHLRLSLDFWLHLLLLLLFVF
jgi:hypothetical protein